MSHWYGKTPDNIESHFSNEIFLHNYIPYTWGCFGQIGSEWTNGEEYSYGFCVPKEIAEKFCEDFNSYFNNIKLSVLYNQKFYRYYVGDNFYGKWENYKDPDPSKESKEKPRCDCELCKKTREKYYYSMISPEYEFTLFKINFDPAYTDFVKYVFSVAIGELTRALEKQYCIYFDINVGYNRYLVDEILNGEVDGNYFDLVWDLDQASLNNCHLLKFDKEDFLLYDNIELANKNLYSGAKIYSRRYESNCYLRKGSLPYPTVAMEILIRGKKEN